MSTQWIELQQVAIRFPQHLCQTRKNPNEDRYILIALGQTSPSPSIPRWRGIAAGTRTECMKKIIQRAADCENGVIRGRTGLIIPEIYIRRWRETFRNPLNQQFLSRCFDDAKLRIAFTYKFIQHANHDTPRFDEHLIRLRELYHHIAIPSSHYNGPRGYLFTLSLNEPTAIKDLFAFCEHIHSLDFDCAPTTTAFSALNEIRYCQSLHQERQPSRHYSRFIGYNTIH